MNSLLLKSILLPLCSLFLLNMPGSGPVATPEPATASCFTFIPTAISPNGDGINDHFQVEQNCELQSFWLQIFDQSDKLVFESRDIHQVWDGQTEEGPATEGYYTWIISYQPAHGQGQVVQQGELVLVR